MTCKTMVEPTTARAYRELQAMLGLVDALAPLSPEQRSRVLEAICIIHGLDDLSAEIRAARS